MRPDHREELATAVERFLADIRRLARAALQQQRDRLLATAAPSRALPVAPSRVAASRPIAKSKTAIAEVPRKPTRKTERARKAATRPTRNVAIDVEQPRPRPAAVTVPVAPAPTPTPAGSPVPTVAEPAAATTVAPADTTQPEVASSRRRGTVKWFNPDKGYGFIRGDDGADAFVHHSAVTEAGLRAFNPGQTVEYDVRRTPKGLQAVALRPGQER